MAQDLNHGIGKILRSRSEDLDEAKESLLNKKLKESRPSMSKTRSLLQSTTQPAMAQGLSQSMITRSQTRPLFASITDNQPNIDLFRGGN